MNVHEDAVRLNGNVVIESILDQGGLATHDVGVKKNLLIE